MTVFHLCDYCARPIEPDEPEIEVSYRGRVDDPGWFSGQRPVNGTVGHYHSRPRAEGEPSCADRVFDAIKLVHEHGSLLEPLETNEEGG